MNVAARRCEACLIIIAFIITFDSMWTADECEMCTGIQVSNIFNESIRYESVHWGVNKVHVII